MNIVGRLALNYLNMLELNIGRVPQDKLIPARFYRLGHLAILLWKRNSIINHDILNQNFRCPFSTASATVLPNIWFSSKFWLLSILVFFLSRISRQDALMDEGFDVLFDLILESHCEYVWSTSFESESHECSMQPDVRVYCDLAPVGIDWIWC